MYDNILDDTEKAKISAYGGMPEGGNWGLIRFDKKRKPPKVIKSLLKNKGYRITKYSGRHCMPYMYYEHIGDDNK